MRKQLFLLSTVCVVALTATEAQARRKLVPNLPSVQIHYEALEALKRNDYRAPQLSVESLPPAYAPPPAQTATRKPIGSNAPKAPQQNAAAIQPKLQWQVGPAGKKLPQANNEPPARTASIRKPVNSPAIKKPVAIPTPKKAQPLAPKKTAAPAPIANLPEKKFKTKPQKLSKIPPLKPIVKTSPTISPPKIEVAPPKLPTLPPLKPTPKAVIPSTPAIKAPSLSAPTLPPLTPQVTTAPPSLPPLKQVTNKPTLPTLPPLTPAAAPPLKTIESSTPPKLPTLPPLKPISKAPALPKLDDLPPPAAPTLKVTTKPAIDIAPPKVPALPPLKPLDSKPSLPPLSASKAELPPLPNKSNSPAPPKLDDLPLPAPPTLKVTTKPAIDIAPPKMPALPPLKPLDSKPSLPPLGPSKAELPPLPDKLDLPPLPALPPKRESVNPEVKIAPALPPLPNASNQPSLPELPPLPNIGDLAPPTPNTGANTALDIAKRHNKQTSLPPLPGMPQKTQTFVKSQNEEKIASLDMPDMPPLPMKKDTELSPVDAVKSSGTPSSTISFSQMERAVPLTSYEELKKIASEVKQDESKGVTILAYAYGSDDQSQLAKRAALARMMAIRTFLIEEGGLDNTQINAMTPKQDAHPDGKERVDIFIR